MPERIYKLQPDRTLALRGFDTFAAAASIHSASPTGFTVSGTFRDPADFAVAVLYDADNYYEHPSIKYLPDTNFTGLTLNFTVQYTDTLQPIDSPKFNWIDWATLDCILADTASTRKQIPLWNHATLANGFGFSPASATFHVLGPETGIQQNDRLTLWYQNLAYDNVVANFSSIEIAFYALGTGTNHFININGRNYAHREQAPVFPSTAGETNAQQASAILSQMGADPDVTASSGSSANSIRLTVKLSSAGQAISVSASEGYGSFTMRLMTPELIAAALAAQINSTNWSNANPSFALMASQSGTAVTVTAARYGTVSVSGTSVTQISGAVFAGIAPGSPIQIDGNNYVVASVQSPTALTLTSPATASAATVAFVAPRGGLDGNLLQLYATSATSSLTLDTQTIQLSGGTSGAWNCSLDFSALGIASLRQCWLTFAPSLVTGSYSAQEWQAVFSNWQLTGTDPSATGDSKALTFVGPGSVRIEETDSACVFTGAWKTEPSSDSTDVYNAFYSRYFAKLTTSTAASLTVTYTCQFTHDLYIGTALYKDGATVAVTLDGVAFSLDCSLHTGAPVVTRRRTHVSVPAGKHTVNIHLQTAGSFCFDFLEAAVLSDAPAALTARTNISPALDFDTDHTYKLPPARLMWIMDQLGYAGPMNEYLGVFWWNQRVQSGGTLSTVQVTFSGVPAQNAVVVLTLNQVDLKKTILGNDTLATIATHFAMYINGSAVGAWASAAGPVLTITSRSPNIDYNLTLTTTTPDFAVIGAAPVAGTYGTWLVDDTATPPINRATRDWHADFYALCAARSREVVTACSMELVNPPDGYVARFADAARTPVSTATGFGTLVSNHCAAGGSKLLAYQKAVYRNIAALQAAAGLTPSIQYGEFLWWYFSLANSIPVGYASYTSPISIGTAAAHGLTTGETLTISGVAGNTAANGSWTITVVDFTHFTLNGSAGNGTYTSGGVIAISGGMAFYDDETKAAAQAALGRPLHLFTTPNDDPTVNGSADATFLRNRLRDHVATLVADMRAAFPAAKCEVLWPYDVNYPTPVPANAPNLGGRLNRFINLPSEWQTKSTSGLDRMKIEALAFGTSLRDMNLAKDAIDLFPDFGWPPDSLRYLVPVFGTATPWHRELALTKAVGIAANNLWAFDHICLYNLDVPERGLERRSIVG